MKKPGRFSPEVRERAVRMILEHQNEHDSPWAAITSIAEKIGCSPETLRNWVRQAERDQGRRPGLTTDARARLKELEREVFELRRANEILKKASAYFAQAELPRKEDFVETQALAKVGVCQRDIAERWAFHPKTVSRAPKRARRRRFEDSLDGEEGTSQPGCASRSNKVGHRMAGGVRRPRRPPITSARYPEHIPHSNHYS
jgi:transposase